MVQTARAGWFALVLLLAGQALAQPAEKRGPLTDPEDGKLDASEWLLEKKGFLPVPTIITEPAVGYGVGLGLMFFRESIGDAVERARQTGHVTPPDLYGVMLAATENGTKFGGAGGMVTFDDDRWRWRGGVARASVNLDFFGAGGQLDTGERKIGYNLDGWISSQQVLRRLGDSNSYVAARWIWLDFETGFDPALQRPAVAPRTRDLTSSGLGLAYEYDSRDNIFTPSRGLKGNVETVFYSPKIGGDDKFEIYRGYLLGYVPAAQAFVVGGRLDARTSRGDVPFYQLPYIDMRGIPAARYQDQSAGVAETELRWNATERWALIGFAGVGRAWGTSTSFGDAGNVIAKGVGVRYLIARRLGLFMGVDIARGPENTAIYIQTGSAWR